ncbi:MAG: hypothetical protein AAFQ88_06955 [Pseudomonadota bacterium]
MRSVVGLTALVCLVPMGAAAEVLRLDFDQAFGNRATIGGESVTNAAGEDLGLFFAEFGVTISVSRADSADLPLVLYESECGGTFANGCTGDDGDLATGPSFGTDPQGRVLIIQENDTETDLPLPGGGTTRGFTDPDDDLNGGTITFTFDETIHPFGVGLDEITILDLDEDLVGTGVTFTGVRADLPALFDAGQQVNLPLSQTLLLNEPVTASTNGCAADNDGPTANVCENDNSLRDFFFVREDSNNLRSISITFQSISGAIEAVAFSPSGAPVVPLPASGLLLAGAAGLLWLRRRRPEGAAV